MCNLITLIVILLSVSCSLKEEIINEKISGFLDKSDHTVNYSFENQGKWLELKKLLGNDLMSAKELDIVDCRGLESKSGQLTRMHEKSYSILNSYYKWIMYQTNKGVCLEVIILYNEKKESFFISVFDARVLLSASKAYQFEKLGLEQANILSETVFLGEPTFKYCKTGGTRYFKNKMIYKDNCIKKTLYSYKGHYPELDALIYLIKGDRSKSLLPIFDKTKK